jgi:hypothetical protein
MALSQTERTRRYRRRLREEGQSAGLLQREVTMPDHPPPGLFAGPPPALAGDEPRKPVTFLDAMENWLTAALVDRGLHAWAAVDIAKALRDQGEIHEMFRKPDNRCYVLTRPMDNPAVEQQRDFAISRDADQVLRAMHRQPGHWTGVHCIKPMLEEIAAALIPYIEPSHRA